MSEYTECDEAGDSLLARVPDGATIGEVRHIVARAMPGESVVVMDNVTDAVMRGLRARTMRQRKCAHPAGCELPAADGDIYCSGCATDPHLRDGSYDDAR